MARLWSSGFELDDPLSGAGPNIGIEFNYNAADVAGVSMVTSPVRSGTYALKIDGTHGLNYIFHPFNTSNGNGPYWARIYLYYTSLPNVANSIIELDAVNGTTGCYVALNTNGSLSLFDGSATQIGSSSSVLSSSTWYRIELHMDMTGGSGHNVIEAALNGSVFATTSVSTQTQQIGAIFFGSGLEGESVTSGTWYYDDLAINDSTGSFQNGYPGDGHIFHQNPAGAGDSTQWTIAGSSPAATNWQSVNETPPDDAVTLVNEAVANKSDFYTVGSSPMGGSDTVNVVHVGVRFNNDTADATTAFKVQIEKASGGTVSLSSSLVPNSTTWITNLPGNTSSQQTAVPYPLTLYQDPDNSNWTKTTIESMEIGLLAGTVGTHKAQITKLWALVEYVPVVTTLNVVVQPGIQDVSGPKIV